MSFNEASPQLFSPPTYRSARREHLTMENATFPLDILELIVSAVAAQSSDDHPTGAALTDLRSCGLVCKELVPISRRYIFETVSITFEDKQSRACLERLASLLERQPFLATYIRRIFCTCCSMRSSAPVYQWEDPVFLPFLQLPNINFLHMDVPYQSISYDMCSPSFFGFRTILERHLMTGSLRHLKLNGFDDLPLESILASTSLSHFEATRCKVRSRKFTDIEFPQGSIDSLRSANLYHLQGVPISGLFRCSRLEHLHIAWIYLSPENIRAFLESQASPPFPNLQTLITASTVDWTLLCNIAEATGTCLLPTLKKLLVTITWNSAHNDIELVVGMLHHVESLEELVISHDACFRYYSADYYPIDMRRITFKCRRTLKRVSMDWLSYDYSEVVPRSICDALEGVQSTNVIEDLDFSFTYRLRDSDFYQTSHQWERFSDILLQDNTWYPQLKKVRIAITLHLNEGLSDEEEDKTLRRLWDVPLAGLCDTLLFEFSLEVRIIRFDWSIDSYYLSD
ncbi:hypothetical protein BJ165DRAFT_1608712 [Panaeolus papilionaceus]|nr:hypothetical protein BJ165DRAFT_1608712 [Panaeolus papilionaceus]